MIGALIIGGIVGWIASMVMKTNDQMGIVANVIVGIVGSSLGFWIAGLGSSAPPTGGIARWLTSIVGASLLIFILRKLGMFRKG